MKIEIKTESIVTPEALRGQMKKFLARKIKSATKTKRKNRYKEYAMKFGNCSSPNHQRWICPVCRRKALAERLDSVKQFLKENRREMSFRFVELVLTFPTDVALKGYQKYFELLSGRLRNGRFRGKEAVLGCVIVSRAQRCNVLAKAKYEVNIIVCVKRLDKETNEIVRKVFTSSKPKDGTCDVKLGCRVFKDKKNASPSASKDRDRLVEKLDEWSSHPSILSYAEVPQNFLPNMISRTGCFRRVPKISASRKRRFALGRKKSKFSNISMV